MSDLRFLDTNTLLYAVSAAPGEATKRACAEALLTQRDWALPAQVLQEFYTQATRPTRREALLPALAGGLIDVWLRFRVQEMTVAVLLDALEITVSHRLSHWDSAIIAAALACGGEEAYSEGMPHGQRVAGARIVDPFR